MNEKERKKLENKLYQLLLELLDTERTYVADLEKVRLEEEEEEKKEEEEERVNKMVNKTGDDHWAGPGLPLGYARKGRICDHTDCQEIIDDHTYRLYPTYCSKCLEVWIKVQERFSFSEYSHV